MSSKRTQIDAVPAVIAGAEINGLGVLRSLAKLHVPTIVLDVRQSMPAMRSGYGRKVVVQTLDGEIFIRELLRLRSQFTTNPVLFLTKERSVETVVAARERLREAYRFSMPDPQVMRMLMHKAEFQASAERSGFPVPRAVSFSDREQLVKAKDLRYPCVIKPVVKTPAYDTQFKKAYRVDNYEELKVLLASIGSAAEMIAQEWIEGGDDAIYFCLQYRSENGRTVESFVGRKLRSWPPQVGGTASCVPATEVAGTLSSLTDRFFSSVGFFGIGSMEYKRDSRSGEFYMIEPTVGRTDFQEEIATLNGVNIPGIAYRSELDLPVLPNDRKLAAAWAVASIDRWSCELQPALRGFPPGLRKYDAIWRWSDPIPWCWSLSERLASRFTVRTRR
jgi:D-aspartate ligase